MAKWIVLCFIALTVVESLWAKPLDQFNNDLVMANAQAANLLDILSFGGVVPSNEPSLNRQKRQYGYYNSIYNPYGGDYKKKRNRNKNRRGYRPTTQRYSVWDLSRK